MSTVFVFGSNSAGRHGKGAAAFARQFFGAEQGVGEGPQGRAYAIPTKGVDGDGRLYTLPLEDIRIHVGRFLAYAREHQSAEFLVTRIGCGLAGHKEADILPMFLSAPTNCTLPGRWRHALTGRIGLIVAGSRDFDDKALLFSKLDTLTASLDRTRIEVISGAARGADTLGEKWAEARGIRVLRFPADWDTWRNAAGMMRNRLMACNGSHLVAFPKALPRATPDSPAVLDSRGTENMISVAREEQLQVRVIPFFPQPKPLSPRRRGL